MLIRERNGNIKNVISQQVCQVLPCHLFNSHSDDWNSNMYKFMWLSLTLLLSFLIYLSISIYQCWDFVFERFEMSTNGTNRVKFELRPQRYNRTVYAASGNLTLAPEMVAEPEKYLVHTRWLDIPFHFRKPFLNSKPQKYAQFHLFSVHFGCLLQCFREQSVYANANCCQNELVWIF